MGRRKGSNIEPSEMFLDGMYDPAYHGDVKNMYTWPLVAAMYEASDKRIRVHTWTSGKVTITSAEGLPVADMRNSDSFDSVTFHIRGGMDRAIKETMTTSNIKYAVSKFTTNSKSALKETLVKSSSDFTDTLNASLRTMVDRAIDTQLNDSVSVAPTVNLTRTAATLLTRVFMGDMVKSDIPPSIQAEVSQAFHVFMDKHNSFNDAVRAIKDCVQGEKIAVFLDSTDGNKGVIVGKIDMSKTVACLDKYTTGSTLPSYANMDGDNNYYGPSDNRVQFNWYKNIEAIPEPLQQQLAIQLVMFKAHTGAENLLPIGRLSSSWGAASNEILPAIGAIGNRANHMTLYLFNA